ncbi:AfsR/SARP family transcriptional regulator [Spongiactinospora rosea]|uniref:AfsR/SARP family transcriptional regulator n=1 Tax=Spongiactinospora rosea TaxID=2248750 RepID=A0A366LLW1_9ACTN|nr:BTAD domain-containing putative transcriptional regulator [Spongiactinospora rosea]RBQ14493.1 AfsR/SARP family transcriptional regulator [Spongiactinospora rosea]
MRFGILGTTRVWRNGGGEVPLGGPARRTLLALLLAAPGETVTVDRLLDALYAPGAAGPAHALQSQVSRLRRILGPGASIERTPTGYRLAADPDDVDAGRFLRLAAEGRRALLDGDPGHAASLLRAALELWRGPALADAADAEPAVAERLEEHRLAALEDRAEADLLLGAAREVTAELRELTDRHPLRERLHGLLMRALEADGRPAEALTAYERARRVLADELGTDPSPDLAALHQRLLHGHSPAVARPPAPLTSFVGRDDDLAELRALAGTARLITLHGPGGVGKTRLSAELAASLPEEVCFVRLTPVRDATEVVQAITAAYGLRESPLFSPGSPPVGAARLVAALADRATLLVLDNCEHVIEAAAALAEYLLSACPRLRIIATSREPLGIPGEHLWQVRPLAGTAAARLFADRAAAVRRGFALDAAGEPGVRRICAALDGLPLAIELAAARMRTHDLAALAARLTAPSPLPPWASRTAEARHQTLRAVVAWSWDLLPGREQEIARRFTVFAGGATADSVHRVAGSGALAETEAILESLADKSLLEVSGGRYRMLETIRAYAAEQLEAAGEGEAVRRAHAAHMLDLARAADPMTRRTEQLDWLRTLAAEHENLRTALRWAVSGDVSADMGFGLLAAMSTYLLIRGLRSSVLPEATALLDRTPPAAASELGRPYALCVLIAGPRAEEHRATAERVLVNAEGPSHPAAPFLWLLTHAADMKPGPALALIDAIRRSPDPWERAGGELIWGYSEYGSGRYETAERLLTSAVTAFRAVGDRWGTALALDALAGLFANLGHPSRALDLTDQALALTHALAATEDTADLLCNRADHTMAERAEEGIAVARADYEQAAALARQSGSATYLAAALRGLGDIALLEGHLDEAERHYTDALARFDPHAMRGIGNRARTLMGLGRIAHLRGDLPAAREFHRRAAETAVSMGAFPETSRPLEALAEVAYAEGDATAAAVLLGAAVTLRGVPTEPSALTEDVRQALGDLPFEHAFTRGLTMTRARALRQAGVSEQVIAASPLHTLFDGSP